MLRRLARIQVGLAVAFLLAAFESLTLESSGKASAKIWKAVGKSEAALKTFTEWALTIPSGLTAKWNTTEEKIVSLVNEGTITEEAGTLEFIGTTTANHTLLENKAGASLKCSVRFLSKNTNREKIVINGTVEILGSFKFLSGKYKLEGSSAFKGTSEILIEGGADLEAGSVTIECKGFSMAAGTAVFQSAGRIVSTGNSFGTGVMFVGEHVSVASSTIEIVPAASQEGGLVTAGAQLGTVILHEWCKVKEALKCGLLEILNKGAASEKGIRLDTAATHTFTALTLDGTAGSPSRLESTTKGTKAKLSLPAGGVEAKGVGSYEDLEATETAPLYAGTEATVGTGCKWVLKEAKPSGATEVKLSLTAAGATGASAMSVVTPQALSPSAAAAIGASVLLPAVTVNLPTTEASSVGNASLSVVTPQTLTLSATSATGATSLGVVAPQTLSLSGSSSKGSSAAMTLSLPGSNPLSLSLTAAGATGSTSLGMVAATTLPTSAAVAAGTSTALGVVAPLTLLPYPASAVGTSSSAGLVAMTRLGLSPVGAVGSSSLTLAVRQTVSLSLVAQATATSAVLHLQISELLLGASVSIVLRHQAQVAFIFRPQAAAAIKLRPQGAVAIKLGG